MPGVKNFVFVVALVLSAVTPAAAVTAQETVYEADTDHELTEQSSISTYEEEGAVTGDVYGLNMSLTVADDAGDARLSELVYRSTGRVFLRLDYNEEISRTIRLYLPAEYVSPQLKQGLEAAESDVTADLEATQDRNHTAVTVTLSEPSTVVFPISTGRGEIADSRSGISDIVASVTGVSLPSLTDRGAEWHYISPTTLNDSEEDHITANATTIQYDASSASSEDPDWVPVPSCDDGTTDICTYSKADQPNRTYILTTTGDPPQVRYREGRSVSGDLGSAVNDAVHGAKSLGDDIFSFLGSDDGDNGGE